MVNARASSVSPASLLLVPHLPVIDMLIIEQANAKGLSNGVRPLPVDVADQSRLFVLRRRKNG